MNDFIAKNWVLLVVAGAAYWYWRRNDPQQRLNDRYPMAYR